MCLLSSAPFQSKLICCQLIIHSSLLPWSFCWKITWNAMDCGKLNGLCTEHPILYLLLLADVQTVVYSLKAGQRL